MEELQFQIENIPAVLWGKPSPKVYLFVHGKMGYKEEGKAFAEIACANGWQVLSIDLPEHGERKAETQTFDPWHVVPELKTVMDYVQKNWHEAALRANSIGAWFSMLSSADRTLQNCLFVSPILDMEQIIKNMMQWASVSEERLKQEKTIQTAFGEILSWEYFLYAKEHPIDNWEHPTKILYAGKDNLTERDTVDAFSNRFSCQLTVMEEGEHWFHTPEQLAVLEQWTKDSL